MTEKYSSGRREAALQGGDGGELGRAEIDPGPVAHPVVEIAGRGRDDRRSGLDAGLVAHAERTAGDLDPRPDLGKDRIDIPPS